MAPTLRAGDHLVAWLGPLAGRWVHAGQVVVVELPGRGLSVKRIDQVGPAGQLWLLGDNSAGSTDSRQLGWLASTNLVGVPLIRYWPRPGRIR